MKNDDIKKLEEAYVQLKETSDLSNAIAAAKQGLEQHNTGVITHNMALAKSKALLSHINQMLNQAWIIPNEDMGKYSNSAFGSLKTQIKDVINDIDNSVRER